MKKSVIDHKGIEYDSIAKMLDVYGISYNVFYQRCYVRKWPLKDCLTKSNKNKFANNGVYTDHEGNMFHSLKEMSEYWNISHKVVEDRLNKLGWDVKRSLTTPVKKFKVE